MATATKKRTTKKTTRKKKAPAKKRTAPSTAERLATLEEHMDMVYRMTNYDEVCEILLERRLDGYLKTARDKLIELGQLSDRRSEEPEVLHTLATALYEFIEQVYQWSDVETGWGEVCDAMLALKYPPSVD